MEGFEVVIHGFRAIDGLDLRTETQGPKVLHPTFKVSGAEKDNAA